MKTNRLGKILSLLFFFTSLLAIGQENVIPPTPNAYELTRFEALQPDLYTGTASVAIPLHTVDFDGWSLPLSINYSASGIRVNQEASEIGLGWALSATAMISRTIMRGDDLQNDSFGKGYAFDTDSTNQPITGNYLSRLQTNQVDTEPDIYNYNFFGYSGSFLFKKKVLASDPLEIVELKKDPTKISYNDTNETFTITTPAGFVGEFSVKERSTNASGSAEGGQEQTWNNEQSFVDVASLQNSGGFRRVTSWYLQKITSPRGKEITFSYDLETDGSSRYHSISQPSWGEIELGTSSDPISVTIQEHVYLTSILIPGEISVNFSMIDREDLQINNYLYMVQTEFQNTLTPRRYIAMNVKSEVTSTIIKSIQFDQTYFNEQYRQPTVALDEARYMRLRLDKVSIDDQDYRFVYYDGVDGLPTKTSFQVDHFGFYNGRVVGSDKFLETPWFSNLSTTSTYQDFASVTYSYSPKMSVNFNYGVAASLKKVMYPTGGSTTFEYEAREYYVDGLNTGFGAEAVNQAGASGNVVGGGVRIKSIVSSDENGIEKSRKNYSYSATNGNSNGLLLAPLANLFYAEGAQPSDPWSFKVMGPTIPNSDGKRIGYSQVTEEVVGGSVSFTTAYDFINIAAAFTPESVTQSGSSPYTQYSYKNGKRLNELSKDLNDVDKASKAINYTELTEESVSGLVYANYSTSNFSMTWFQYTVPAIFMEVATTVSTNYESNGQLQSTETLTYNDEGQLSSRSLASSAGKTILEEYVHPQELTGTSGPITQMITENQLDPIIETRKSVNGQLVSAIGKQYSVEDGNVILRKIHEYNKDGGSFISTTDGVTFSGGYEEKIHFTKYDTQGKLQEYIGRDGITNAFIWQNNYPVVRGTGIVHSDLQTAYTASLGASFEDDIRSHTLTQNGQVSTYAYEPLVGMTASINPAKEVYSYAYDINERLSSVKSTIGGTPLLMSTYNYNFVSQDQRILDINLGANTIDFGVVEPNESTLKYIPLRNDGTTALVALFTLPTDFSSPINGATLPPETSLLFPLVYTGPDVSTDSAVSETIDLQTVGPVVTGDLSFVATATIAPHTRLPVPSASCYEITQDFSQAVVEIVNTGNSSLTIFSGTSDDSNITINASYPLVIAPNGGKAYITAQLGSTIGNWDNLAQLTFVSDRTDLVNFPIYIDIKYSCN